MTAILILTLLLTKHFVCDFLLQTSYQFAHKGQYGHFGGLLHAGIHSAGTFVVFYFFTSLEWALIFALFDGLVHYHVDWTKCYLNKRFNLSPLKGNGYWPLFGLDQFLHQLTYIGLVVFMFKFIV